MELVKQKETPLLSRERYVFTVEHEQSTPPRQQLQEDIAKKLGKDKALVTIKHIYTRYGARTAKIIAHVYKDAKDRDLIEEKALLVRHLSKSEQKAHKAAKPAKTKQAKK